MFPAKSNPVWAVFALVLLALIWGYNWVVMKIALQYAPPFDFAAMRAFYGALSLFLLMIALGKPLKPQAIWGSFCYGMLHSGGAIGLLTWALVSGGAGKTAILSHTMAFWTLLFAWIFLGERLRGAQWWSVMLAFCGLIFILQPLSLNEELISKGVAIIAGISWAISSLVAKKLNQKQALDLLSFTAWQLLFGSLPLIIISLLVPTPPINWSGELIAALIYNVLPGTAIAWLLWLYGLRNLSAGSAGLTALATPVIGVLAAWLHLGEIPKPTESVGMLLIFVALVINSILTMKLLANQQ